MARSAGIRENDYLCVTMADNYLENRMEALREKQKRTVVVKQNPSLESLLKRNRSFRGYDRSVEVSEDQLLEMVKTVTWVASGMNAQPLRFRLVTGEEAAKVHPLVKLGAALPEEHLPHPGEEPSAYIVVGSVVPENRIVDMDLGIAAQSILLKATEMGFGGIFILNFNPEAVDAAETHRSPGNRQAVGTNLPDALQCGRFFELLPQGGHSLCSKNQDRRPHN